MKPTVQLPAALPTEHGEFQIYAYDSALEGETHVALVRGDVGDGRSVAGAELRRLDHDVDAAAIGQAIRFGVDVLRVASRASGGSKP